MGSLNRHLLKIITVGIVSLVIMSQTSAQEVRITEEEIRLEQSYIEALTMKMDGDLEAALKAFEEIASKERRNHAVLYEIARIQKKLEREEDALQTIDRALRLESDNLWYLGFKAELQELMGNYAGAIETFNSIINIEPYNSGYYFRKTENFLRLGKPADAIITLDELLEEIGSTEEIHQRRYDIFRNMGEFEKATEELEALLNIFPGNTEYLYMLATHYKQEGLSRESDSLYALILEIDPSDAKAQLALSGQQKLNSGDTEYLLGLQKLFENDRADLDPKILELIPFVEKLTEKEDPKLAEALLKMVSYLETTHKDEAKVFALKADIQQLSGDSEGAILSYRKALQLEKGIYSVWEQLLYLLYEKGEFEALYKLSEEALDVYPNQIRVWIFNAKALRGLKRNKEALNSLEQAGFMAIGQDFINQEILSTRAAIQHDMGDLDESRKTFNEALSIIPDNQLVIARMAFYMAKNDSSTADAEELLNKNLKLFPNSPILTGTLALVQFKLGQKENAVQLLTGLNGQQVMDSRLQNLEDRIQAGTDIKDLFEYWKVMLEGGPS